MKIKGIWSEDLPATKSKPHGSSFSLPFELPSKNNKLRRMSNASLVNKIAYRLDYKHDIDESITFSYWKNKEKWWKITHPLVPMVYIFFCDNDVDRHKKYDIFFLWQWCGPSQKAWFIMTTVTNTSTLKGIFGHGKLAVSNNWQNMGFL